MVVGPAISRLEALASVAAICLPASSVRALAVEPAGLLAAPLATAEALAAPLSTVVPLSLCGGAYCIKYTIDDQPFRAVIDTGSPFLLVDGTCGQAATLARWGCYKGASRPSGLPDTDELFGGEDVGVQWRRGAFRVSASAGQALGSDDVTFGVVRSYIGKGGGGAVFLGLVKRRLPRIRPTLIEQLNVVSMNFDFIGRSMRFSPVPLIDRTTDAVPLVDLRPRGAPVATYACRVRRMVVNGVEVALDRPTVAIIDTGTTGLTVSDSLFDSGRLPLPMREARLELATERG
eukprot:3552125-Prymnesium_polylepis.1